jgi:aryl-alcohol dehydrogenase-like predicted oxidoreductase
MRNALAGAGALALGRGLRAADAAAPAGAYDPYEIVPLGATKLKVSRVGFGTGMKGWLRESNQTRLGKEGFETLLRRAYERGVRFFDLADLYGSHPYVAAALAKHPRDAYTLLTKIWVRPEKGLPENERPDADVVVERFRKELKTDAIDVVLLHCMTDADWPAKQKRQMDLLAGLKAKGVIRAHGVSVHSLPALEAAAAEPWVDSVNVRINATGDKMDDKDPAKVAAALRKVRAAGKGIVGMKLIGEGTFRDSEEKKDASIRFALANGGVDTMAVGFESIAEVDDFAGRVKKVPRA